MDIKRTLTGWGIKKVESLSRILGERFYIPKDFECDFEINSSKKITIPLVERAYFDSVLKPKYCNRVLEDGFGANNWKKCLSRYMDIIEYYVENPDRINEENSEYLHRIRDEVKSYTELRSFLDWNFFRDPDEIFPTEFHNKRTDFITAEMKKKTKD
ncbi:hypothetical protein K0A97_01900 [Patescibacteria group bacterium]|nr:hypothetical protein [Patescibacteria group bacterium]